MLWLSLHLPHLALEIFTRAEAASDLPFVVMEGQGSRQRVHARNRAAAARGVVPGMSPATARALLGEHRVLPRRPEAEESALARLADWAGQFTPTVSLLPPQGLLLEIGGSLLLFDGVAALQQRIQGELKGLGYHASSGIAPTPSAAWLLARAGRPAPVMERNALRSALADLPLGILELSPAARATLEGMGLRHIGECLRLPRAGLARRLGPEVLHALLRALGELPDPRPLYLPPAHFAARLTLPSPVENSEGLIFAIRRLLDEMEGSLRGRGSGIRQLTLEFHHRGHAPSRLPVGLLSASREAAHLVSLLRCRLDAFPLPAPVEEITLSAGEFEPLDPVEGDFFSGPDAKETGERLVERLQARLGAGAVHGCRLVPEHRPERAWQPCPPGHSGAAAPLHPAPRPLWLLAPPQRLEEEGGIPRRNGRLRLLQGPERIEAGWWEGGTARDYFVAEDDSHSRLWVFREGNNVRHWFLHGIFS